MIYVLIAGLLAVVAGLLVRLTNSASAPTVDLRTTGDNPADRVQSPLHQKQWIHGSADCKSNTDPAIEVFRVDRTSYILRQNKCVSYEAPFMYLLFGTTKTILLDTGATKRAADFPLYETVQSLVKEFGEAEKRPLIVMHSHHHTDHYSGDSQFVGQQNVTLVEPTGAAMREFFAFEQWPDRESYIDLGERRTDNHSNTGTPGGCHYPLRSSHKMAPGWRYNLSWRRTGQALGRIHEERCPFG